ncbi:MAG: adenylyl-sulfate kinase [Cohnella sp.]|nr:adenylyl-sulfate kinase [Cohnella sp.]
MSHPSVVWQSSKINREDRYVLNQHPSFVLWFTGLSGAGKSTLAYELERKLHEMQIRTYVLDGDNLRHGINCNLGFSREERRENIRRAGEISKLFVEAGIVTLASFISPFREDREGVRELFAPREFIEVYVECPIEECARRDPKGHYKRVKEGTMKNFTGVDSDYEPPLSPEIVLRTDEETVSQSCERIVHDLTDRGLIPRKKVSALWD